MTERFILTTPRPPSMLPRGRKGFLYWTGSEWSPHHHLALFFATREEAEAADKLVPKYKEKPVNWRAPSSFTGA